MCIRDRFSANAGDPNTVYVWSPNQSRLVSTGAGYGGDDLSTDVAAGDLDGDDDIDIVVANGGLADSEIWFNSGTASFTRGSVLQLTGGNAVAVVLGDLDLDGDLDIIESHAELFGIIGRSNRVWLNDGAGNFTLAENFGESGTEQVALGDLDCDGDLDVVLATVSGARVFLNQPSAD